MPQFAGSVLVSAQRAASPAPHFESGAAHVALHPPAEQTCPAGQAAPHAPQLWLSVRRSTHVPAQSVPRAPAQVSAQTPAAHTCPAAQPLPQPPQCAGSFSRFVQIAWAPVPQTWRGAEQLGLQAPFTQS